MATGAAIATAGALPAASDGEPLLGALFAAGAMLGARGPDWMEVYRWRDNRRYSLLPHRTITHWPVLWLGLWLLAEWWITSPEWAAAAHGFLLAGAVHLLLDALTPTGVPLTQPLGRRVAWPVYRAGERIPELLITAGVWAGTGVYLSTALPVA
jgi:membrane-bound metal-dependent hydrolase YbcI (DUF457 family)